MCIAKAYRWALDGLAGDPAGELVGVFLRDVVGDEAGLGPQEYVKEATPVATMSAQKL